jgi:hypothetical protein
MSKSSINGCEKRPQGNESNELLDPWPPDLTLSEAADLVGQPETRLKAEIMAGRLIASKTEETPMVSWRNLAAWLCTGLHASLSRGAMQGGSR